MSVKKPTKRAATHNNNQVRIIGGQWRGRKLGFPNIDGLRPTGDRMRETLFNWLAPMICGADAIDLFAGSGALGFEALSRGANQVDFVELDQQATKSIQDNLTLLNCNTAKINDQKVHNQRAQSYLANHAPASIDLLFLDPPFALGIHNELIENIMHSRVMREGGLIYIEAPADCNLQLPENWHLLKEKLSGQVKYHLYKTA